MLQTIIAFLKSWLGFPNLKELGADLAKPIEDMLSKFERRIITLFIVVIILLITGFSVVLGCLENGFHWKYLLQI